ncbi:hypothetical protein Hanom_Chr12g01136571 [Helianthus anomalus]
MLEEQVLDDTIEDTDLVSRKKQRVDTEPSVAEHVSPTVETESATQNEPEVATTTAQENIVDFFEMSFQETTTTTEPESLSGLRFDVSGNSSGGMFEHDENILQATKKMKFIEEFDSDDDMDVDAVKLQKRVIVLEHDSLLKHAQISSLQDQVFNKDQTINQLQSDVNHLMSLVFDLKVKITSWRYDHDKKIWLVIRESGHREYYSKESQFESWTKIDLKNLLRDPYHDSDPNQRGTGWAFLSKLEREVKNDFPNMKYIMSSVKTNHGIRDTYTGRTMKTLIRPPIEKEKIITAAPKFLKDVLKNFKFLEYDPKIGEV